MKMSGPIVLFKRNDPSKVVTLHSISLDHGEPLSPLSSIRPQACSKAIDRPVRKLVKSNRIELGVRCAYYRC